MEDAQIVEFVVSTEIYWDVVVAVNVSSEQVHACDFAFPHLHTVPTHSIIHIFNTLVRDAGFHQEVNFLT
jgi:hypothetical protein